MGVGRFAEAIIGRGNGLIADDVWGLPVWGL